MRTDKHRIGSLWHCWSCGRVIEFGRPRCDCPPYVPPPEPEPEPRLWEVSVSDGTSMSGGLRERRLVRAKTKEEALKWAEEHLDGSGYPEYSAHPAEEPENV